MTANMRGMGARNVVAEFEVGGEPCLVIAHSPPRAACLARLSPAEVDVIDRCLADESLLEIAKARRASVRTVANQIASAYHKLGIGSRQELQCLLARETAQPPK